MRPIRLADLWANVFLPSSRCSIADSMSSLAVSYLIVIFLQVLWVFDGLSMVLEDVYM
jgi:hypothetical protein